MGESGREISIVPEGMEVIPLRAGFHLLFLSLRGRGCLLSVALNLLEIRGAITAERIGGELKL